MSSSLKNGTPKLYSAMAVEMRRIFLSVYFTALTIKCAPFTPETLRPNTLLYRALARLHDAFVFGNNHDQYAR